MDQEERAVVEKSSVRCKISGPSLSSDYFGKPVAMAYDGAKMYLRVGDDVYEGQEVKNSCEGANIHFSVDMREAESSTENPSGFGLSNFGVTNSEYVFWPAGSMKRTPSKSVPLPITGSTTAAENSQKSVDEALAPVIEMLGLDPLNAS